MLSDNEKTALAKKNYQDFLDRMSKKLLDTNLPLNARRLAFVFPVNGKMFEDHRWTDENVTPTAFYRWIHSYNQPIEKIILDDKVFNDLVGMVAGATQKDVLQFDDTMVYPQSRKVTS